MNAFIFCQMVREGENVNGFNYNQQKLKDERKSISGRIRRELLKNIHLRLHLQNFLRPLLG
jgi:hypothetical protein